MVDSIYALSCQSINFFRHKDTTQPRQQTCLSIIQYKKDKSLDRHV
jgi:hypothetical protein